MFEDEEAGERLDWEPLTLHRIDRKKKRVQEDTFFRMIELTDQQYVDLVTIRNLIADGAGLPARFYRRSRVGDRLLVTKKIMHLHLGGQGSNALLYLMQFPDHVLFLCVDTHIHLEDVPVGKKFNFNGIRKFQAMLRAIRDRFEPPRPR